MKKDLFFGRKSVHIKLTKETHAALRERLFRHDITMQDFFQYAAEKVLHEGPRAETLLQKISKKRVMAQLDKTQLQYLKKLGEIDRDMLYNLLDDSSDTEDTDEE